VATFWSDLHSACVPESRPDLKVFEPAAGAVLAMQSQGVVLRGYAEDPREGPISDKIMWSLDGTAKGIGASVAGGTLAAGSHTVTALVQNSRGLQRVVKNDFVVSANAAKVFIDSPAAMAAFGTDEQVIFRGQAFSYQPGDIPSSGFAWDEGGTPLGTGAQVQ